MKNTILKSLFLGCVLLIVPFFVSAKENINLYFFYGDGCPHCEKEEIFLDKLEKDYDNIEVFRYETWRNKENADLLQKVGEELDVKITGVPVLIIGDEAVIGYYSDETSGKKIKDIIDEHVETGCEDRVAEVIGGSSLLNECIHGCEDDGEECPHECGCSASFSDFETEEKKEYIQVPILGEVNLNNFSLPLLTFVIAATDGFNPCAMWVLLFLISLLLGMEDKKRMWILGSAFILSSGIVYFFFLSAWLNLFLFLGFVFWIRVSIGLVALFSGSYHLKEAWENRDGCKVIKGGKRKRVFEKLRVIVGQKSFIISLFGIVLLATAVNLVELVCSAGLPAVYTQILSMSGLSPWQHYSYLVFYIVIFMLDDMLIFAIAMTTLQMKGISSKYTNIAQWVGGIVMLILGILLIFKPGWVMFG